MVLAAKNIHRLPGFFSDETFREIQHHVEDLFKDQPDRQFFKKSDSGLIAKDIIERSQFRETFDKLSIDYENSYLNVSKPSTKEGWHYDHSDYTLIVPVFLENTDQGTVYSHFLRREKGPMKIITTALNFVSVLFTRRKETFEINNGLLIPGTRLYHSAPAVDPDAVRISLVVHLCTQQHSAA